MRAKGEATLAEEARVAAQKKREELARKLAEKRQAALLMSHGMMTAAEQEKEAKKQRVMAMLLGGKKGNTKKFFKAWVIGLRVVKNERLTGERKARWQKGCSCHESHTGPCNIELQLCEPQFELPFDALQRTLGSMSGYGGSASYDGMWRSQSMPQLMSAGRSTASMTKPPCVAGGLPALPGTTSQRLAGLTAQARLGQLPMPPGAASPTPYATTTQVAPPPFGTTSPQVHHEPFVDTETAEVVVHHRTGRQCLLDTYTMRVMFMEDNKGGHVV